MNKLTKKFIGFLHYGYKLWRLNEKAINAKYRREINMKKIEKMPTDIYKKFASTLNRYLELENIRW